MKIKLCREKYGMLIMRVAPIILDIRQSIKATQTLAVWRGMRQSIISSGTESKILCDMIALLTVKQRHCNLDGN